MKTLHFLYIALLLTCSFSCKSPGNQLAEVGFSDLNITQQVDAEVGRILRKDNAEDQIFAVKSLHIRTKAQTSLESYLICFLALERLQKDAQAKVVREEALAALKMLFGLRDLQESITTLLQPDNYQFNPYKNLSLLVQSARALGYKMVYESQQDEREELAEEDLLFFKDLVLNDPDDQSMTSIHQLVGGQGLMTIQKTGGGEIGPYVEIFVETIRTRPIQDALILEWLPLFHVSEVKRYSPLLIEGFQHIIQNHPTLFQTCTFLDTYHSHLPKIAAQTNKNFPNYVKPFIQLVEEAELHPDTEACAKKILESSLADKNVRDSSLKNSIQNILNRVQ